MRLRSIVQRMAAPGRGIGTERRSGGAAVRAIALVAAAVAAAPAVAQQQVHSRVDIAFNRFYDYDEMTAHLKSLVEAYPELLTMQSLGQSEEKREIWLVTMNNAKTGSDSDKPAMWIDGNIHGNEIQAAETVLYSIWYLAKSYGRVEPLTRLIDRAAFYFVPMSNPDGRANWFHTPANPNNYRSGLKPTDNDYDGLLDEDGPDDLDGDGHIGAMWRADPDGTHVRNRFDPRIFDRVPEGETGEWSFAGGEGIDNDGDGRINEDGPGGYDMNRNWPADWQPNYVQFGAGDHPFSSPETRAGGMFILGHPNIAAGQSYHNAGGMILRGPGAAYREGVYSRADVAVYDRLARAGVEMLPFYRSMIIHADLYVVHGGFVNWLAESLGIVSFTNELWTDQRILQSGATPAGEEAEFRWRDRMLFGQTFTDWTEHDHPLYGKVLIGGGTKYADRIPPPFMLEEECHRNFAFTMFHAGNMPLLTVPWIEVKPLGDAAANVWQITLEVANEKIIPTRLARADDRNIGQPDRLVLSGEGIEVVASGTLNDRIDRTLEPVDYRRAVIPNDAGIPGEARRTFRYLVTGAPGSTMTLRYEAEKAADLQRTFQLEEGTLSPSSPAMPAGR
jgi:hypothetical protein